MTDRELLEYAAKAAGWVSWDWLAADGVLNVYDADGRHCRFDPITDDGDALRLAVKLDLFANPIFFHYRSLERFGRQDADDATATRSAIVRAAAEFGKAMQ